MNLEKLEIPAWVFVVTMLLFVLLIALSFFSEKQLSWSPLGFVSSSNGSLIIAGSVSSTGDANGKGFASCLKKNEIGVFEITYDRPFDKPPVFVASVLAANKFDPNSEDYRKVKGGHPADTTINVNSNRASATVWLYDITAAGDAELVNEGFNFIVVGEVAQQ